MSNNAVANTKASVPASATAAASQLRANLTDAWVQTFLALLIFAQAADIITTVVGLNFAGLKEDNPLFAPLLGASFLGGSLIKVAAFSAVALIALVRLPAHRARVAICLAGTLSLLAPLLNLHTIFS